jgi:hypothetical protein
MQIRHRALQSDRVGDVLQNGDAQSQVESRIGIVEVLYRTYPVANPRMWFGHLNHRL